MREGGEVDTEAVVQGKGSWEESYGGNKGARARSGRAVLTVGVAD